MKTSERYLQTTELTPFHPVPLPLPYVNPAASVRNHGSVVLFFNLISTVKASTMLTPTKNDITNLRRDCTPESPFRELIVIASGVLASGGDLRFRKDSAFVAGSYTATRVFSFVNPVQNVSIRSNGGRDDAFTIVYSA